MSGKPAGISRRPDSEAMATDRARQHT